MFILAIVQHIAAQLDSLLGLDGRAAAQNCEKV